MELPVRKRIRLKSFDYSSPGYYFITLCTEDKEKILGDIVGHGLQDVPQMQDTVYGKLVRQQLEGMARFYDNIILEKYVVMPNHIHLLIHITGAFAPEKRENMCNSKIASFVGTFKRFTNRKAGKQLWQNRFHDHVIRGEKDYQKIWMYIETNPLRWESDCFYN